MSENRSDAETEALLDEAEAALDRRDPELALTFCDQVLELAPEHAGALYLAAEAHRDLAELEVAEHLYRRILRSAPDHGPSWSALGAALFDQLRFEEAQAAIHRALRCDPRNPEALYWHGMLRERRGDFRGADRNFLRASRIDPEHFPRPVPLDDATVEAVVVEVLQTLHPSIRAFLEQVAIVLEEVPEIENCRVFNPPAPPGELLGFFSGVPMTERRLEASWTHLPSAIVLYRRNLERIAWDRAKMVEELRVTVFHEIGHFLGLDEDDLAARGLD